MADLIECFGKALHVTQSNERGRKPALPNTIGQRKRKNDDHPIKNHERLPASDQKSSYEITVD